MSAFFFFFFFCKKLAFLGKNSAFIQNNSVGAVLEIFWFCFQIISFIDYASNIWRLGRVRDTKFSKNVSSEMLLNAEKCWGNRFYRFGVIKGKTNRE